MKKKKTQIQAYNMKRRLWVKLSIRTGHILETRPHPWKDINVLDIEKTECVKLKELYRKANDL